jgi:hypothetical protein
VGQDGKGVEGHGQMRFVYSYNVAGHIPARISDVPSWDAQTIFFINFECSAKLVQEQL